MSQFCLFEEYIYNLFLHFARVCEDAGRFDFPVLFQNKRLSLNDQKDTEMALMENYYARFRMLGKGRQYNFPEDESALKHKDKVEQIWASKVEFILAMKEFYKSDVLPLKKEIQPPRIENLVSKKLGEYAQSSRQRIKIKEANDLSSEQKKLPEVALEKKSIKLKNFVEKTFMSLSPEKDRRKIGPVMSNATRKLMNIRRLIELHKSEALKMRLFSVKDANQTQRLLQNLSMNLHSLAQIGEIQNYERLNRTERLSFAKQQLTDDAKKAVVNAYLKTKFVSDEKLF